MEDVVGAGMGVPGPVMPDGFVAVSYTHLMENVTEEGQKVVFSELAWKKAYQGIEQLFPKRTIQGWFLCGVPGNDLSPLNYWKQHVQYFQGPNKLMYLNNGIEGDETVYITSEDGFYKLRGYSIYYERNQMMQDYMVPVSYTNLDVYKRQLRKCGGWQLPPNGMLPLSVASQLPIPSFLSL